MGLQNILNTSKLSWVKDRDQKLNLKRKNISALRTKL